MFRVVCCDYIDYYDFLAGDKKAAKSYAGEFMSQYKWARDAAVFFEYRVLKNKV